MTQTNTTSIKTSLRKNFLTAHMQDKIGTNKYDRQGIADVFAEFYEEVYTSTTRTHGHEGSRNQPQHTMTPVTMQQLDDAINHIFLRQSSRHERCQRRDDQTLHEQRQKNNYCDCKTMSSSQVRNHHRIGKARRLTSHTKAETRHLLFNLCHVQTLQPASLQCRKCKNNSTKLTYSFTLVLLI